MKISEESIKVIKFLITGGTAAFVEFVLFYILHGVYGVNPLVSQTISFLVGFVISFVVNKLWVFGSTGNTKHELLKYCVLAVINIILSNIVVYLLLSLGVVFWMTKIIVMAMVATWNYLLFQKIIFTSK